MGVISEKKRKSGALEDWRIFDDEATWPPMESRGFLMGISSMQSGLENNDGSIESAIKHWTSFAELTNLFFHIQWNELQGKPLLTNHEWLIGVGDTARKHGLKLSLTMDFTHEDHIWEDALSGIGLPDRIPGEKPLPAGGINNETVQRAYLAELMAIVRKVRPDYVFIGVEINIFYYRCPEMWPGYVDMYKACYDAIKAELPDTAVSAYTAGVPNNKEIQAMRMLLPKLDSLAYSIYCDKPWQFPDGYLTRVRRIEPDLPLFLPEFGIRSLGGRTGEPDQLRALHYYFKTFASVETEGIVWCHLYDRDFSQCVDWFREAFETIGMRRLDGSPKPSYALWKRTFDLPPLFRDLWRELLDKQSQKSSGA